MLLQFSLLFPCSHKHITDAVLKMEKTHIGLICSVWINEKVRLLIDCKKAQIYNSDTFSLNDTINSWVKSSQIYIKYIYILL